MRFWNDLLTMSFWRSRRRRLRDFSCIPWLPPPLGRRTRPDPVTRNRLAAARLVFILGTGGSFLLPRSHRLPKGGIRGLGEAGAGCLRGGARFVKSAGL